MSNKTRKWRSAIAMVLVICMLFSIFPVAAFAQDDNTPAAINYVSLGDSMTNGYGLDGYYYNGVNVWGFLQEAPKAYPTQVATNYDWDLTQLALSGFRAEEVHYLLEYGSENAYAGDDYTHRAGLQRFDDSDIQQWWPQYAGAENMSVLFQNSIKDADVVSIQLGTNNFGTFMTQRLCYHLSEMTGFSFGGSYFETNIEEQLEVVAPEAAEYGMALYDELMNILTSQLIENGVSDESLLEFCKSMTEAAVYSAMGFVNSYKGIVDWITANSEAEVILVAMPNSLDDMKIAIPAGANGESVIVDLGDFFGVLVEAANAYIIGLPAVYAADAELNKDSTYDSVVYYADPGSIELLITQIATGNFDGYDVLEDRIVGNVTGTIFPLLKDAIDSIVDDYGLQLVTVNTNDVASYKTFAEAWQEYIITGVNEPTTNLTDNKILSCAIYLAIEDAIVEAAGLEVLDVNALSALVMNQLDSVFTQIQSALNPNQIVDMDAVTAAIIPVAIQGANTFKSSLETQSQQLAFEQIVNATSAEFGDLAPVIAHYALANNVQDLSSVTQANVISWVMTTYFDTVSKYVSRYTAAGITPALGDALKANDTIMGLFNLFARYMIGDGIGCHPSAQGHTVTAEAIIKAYDEHYTVDEAAKDKILVALEAVKDIIVEYYDDAYAYAYDYAKQNGYIEDATDAIDGVIAALEAIDLSGIEMTDAFRAELQEQINDVIDVLVEAQELIEEADVLDQDTLDALMELLGEAGEMMTQLGTTLEQAGVDVAEQVIVPALEEAYEVLMNEVVPAIIADLEEAIAEGTAWLMEKAQEAIDALVEALPEMAQFAHDYVLDFLLNNPEEVIAFFNEYGDDIIDVVGEYGEYALAAMGYIAAEYGDEILAFVMENDEEILEVTAMLLEEHGPHAAELIQVYAEELGYCQAVRDLIADLEDQIADLREQLEEELYKQLAELEKQLEDLYAALEDASGDVAEEIQAAIDAIEDVIAEVEAAIEAIEDAIADLEAQLAEAQKALEEAIAAVEAVVEAIKAAIENGVETVEEILAAIDAIVDFAEETIAGVQTAIEGIVNAAEDVAAFVEELIANGIVAAEMIEEIIDTVMDIIDGVKAELEKGDIDAAIEAIRNELTNGYEELSAMLAAIDTAIAAELDAIVADLEAALEQAQDEFEEALYNATHGELACDAKTIAVYGGETVATEDGYAAIVAEEWGLEPTEAVDMADVILYQADPQIFVTALLDSVSGDYAANWAKYIGDEAVLAYLEQAKAELKDVLADEYGEEAAAVAEPLVDSFLFAVVEYAVANIETIEYLSRINEDALIVAAGMYNPVQGLSVTYGGEIIDIEAMCQYLIEVTDVYNLLYAIAAQNAVFVDVSEAEAAAFDNVDVDSLLARAMALKAEATVLLREAADTMNEAADALDAGDTSKYNSLLAQYERLMAQAEALYAQVDEIVEDVMPMVEALDSSYATEAGHAYIAEQILAAIEKADHECEWAIDDNEHCYYCVNCGEEFVCGAHEFDSEEDTVCDVCGYERIIIDPTPEITTSSIVVYYLNENTAIKEPKVTPVTTTGSYEFDIPATIVYSGTTYNYNALEDKDTTDAYEPVVSGDTFFVDVDVMPTTNSAIEFVLKYVAAGGGEEDDTIAVTGVALDKDTLSLKVGNTAALTATVTPDNATNKAVTWASSDESVATVADGVVTAVAKGTATITVTTVDGGLTDTCAVTVTKASSGGSFGGGGGGAYTKAKPEVIVPDNAVPAGVTVTADYADYQTVNGAQDFAAKDNNIAVIGGRDSSAEVIVKPAGAVESFTHPVQLVVPVSKSALQNVDDVNKLTLALVTTDAQGNIQLTYVGGNYDASKGTFTAYVNQPGKYVLVEKLDLVKIELTIDRYVIFVNGEPIINDVPSRIVNNRTLAPAARVLHHMGCTVEWLSDTRTVEVTLPNGDVLNLPVDEPIPGFGAAPVIENGRTLVPIAYIADMMDAHVQWVGNDRKVIIVK